MKFNEEDIVTKSLKIVIDKYINDITITSNNEISAVFDLIKKKYAETNECPICDPNHYRYNDVRVGMSGNYLFIGNGDYVSSCNPVNYCPICGKKTGN